MRKEDARFQELKREIEKYCFIRAEESRALQQSSPLMKWLFDFRMIILKSRDLDIISEIFWERYRDHIPFQIGGLEMAAIPLVSAILMKFHEHGRSLNGFIIRKSRKKSGLLKMIEGEVTNDPIILVDDLINSGSSILRQIKILKELQKKVDEVFVLLRFRDSNSYPFLQEEQITLSSLFELNDFKETLSVANIAKKIKDQKNIQNPFVSEPIWYFQGKSPNYFFVFPKSAPIVSEDTVFFGTDDGIFFACKTETGDIQWTYKVPFGAQGKFIFSTPVVYKNLVFFGAYDGNLYALDKNTGKRMWVFMEADWIGSSPCIAEDLKMIFIGLEYGLFKKRGGISGLNIETGDKIWEFRSEELTHGSPAYSKKFCVVGCGSNDHFFYLLHAKTGKLLWKFETEGDIKYAPCFSETHGVVVVLGFGEIVYVLDIKTGAIVSKYTMGFGGYSTPIIFKDTVICTSFDKHIHCFNIFSGELIWKCDTGARIFATPEIINGKVYVGSNNARLYEIDPETGKILGIFHTRERIVNKIAYDPKNKIFFVPTFANEVFALKLKQDTQNE